MVVQKMIEGRDRAVVRTRCRRLVFDPLSIRHSTFAFDPTRAMRREAAHVSLIAKASPETEAAGLARAVAGGSVDDGRRLARLARAAARLRRRAGDLLPHKLARGKRCADKRRTMTSASASTCSAKVAAGELGHRGNYLGYGGEFLGCARGRPRRRGPHQQRILGTGFQSRADRSRDPLPWLAQLKCYRRHNICRRRRLTKSLYLTKP